MERSDLPNPGQPARTARSAEDGFPDEAESAALRDKHYNATIIDRIDVHDDLMRIRVRPDAPIVQFEPGQYVALGLGNWEPRMQGVQDEQLAASRHRKLVRRAYSISCPMWGQKLDEDADATVLTVAGVDYLEFYIILVREAATPEQKPPALTPRLFLKQAGDRMVVEKKITGHYQLGEIDPGDTVLMLGTGTGEAPHNAMAAELLSRGHQGAIVVATSVRMQGDLGYLSEHRALMDRFPRYKYLPLTTREPQNIDRDHPDFVGKQYLQTLFLSGKLAEMAGDPLSPTNTHVFLCGNPAMIGYVPPGAEPPTTPGMLPLLRDAGFVDDEGSGGAGTIRFEKYW